jgi:carboxylate-amine ligase
LIQFVDDVVDELGCRKEINHVYNILREGTSADHQLRVFHETGSLEKVVDHLIEETMRDCV